MGAKSIGLIRERVINLKPNARRRGKACQAAGIYCIFEGFDRIMGPLFKDSPSSMLALPHLLLTAMGFLARRRENEATGVYLDIHEDCGLSGSTAKNSSAKNIVGGAFNQEI
jgi:hypothetical protein